MLSAAEALSRSFYRPDGRFSEAHEILEEQMEDNLDQVMDIEKDPTTCESDHSETVSQASVLS
jgi:hypothetical protein